MIAQRRSQGRRRGGTEGSGLTARERAAFMEDVVALRFHDAHKGEACVFVWGRLFNPVDPEPLLAAMRRVLPRAGYDEVSGLRICSSLRDAHGFDYFYEACIAFAAKVAQEPIHSKRWKKKQRTDEALRKSMYVLGRQIEPDPGT